ncbi:MAG TPA: GNAT family N-acetyltransferase [Flavitalea sp.]|nr:GNAT family N-acetyltransferase [Flavitalea sp.]
MTSFLKTDSTNTDFQQLVQLLDADLKFRDGDEHTFYAQFNKIVQVKNVIVCYIDDYAVGCGAFKPFDEDAVEIKRMFVRPEFRGRGLGLEILRALELWAAESGYPACVLETGKKQPEAIQLYQKAGYAIIPNYGQYAGIENSVCMRKIFTSTKQETRS